MLTVEAAQKEFEPTCVYVNTASIGLPPGRVIEAVDEALDTWRAGRAEAAGYDALVDDARRRFAGLVSVSPDRLAIGKPGLDVHRARRGRAARRRPRARGRGRLHLGPVPVHRPRRPRRPRGERAARSPGRVDPPRCEPRRGERRTVRRRPSRPGRTRRARRGRRAPRLSHVHRCHPGSGLAAVRRRPLRFRVVRRLQVAHVAPRNGLRRRTTGTASDAATALRRLVCGRRSVDVDLRTAAQIGPHGAPARYLARVALLGRHRFPRSICSRRSASRRSTGTMSVWRTRCASGSVCRAAIRRSSRWRPPAGWKRCGRPTLGRPSARARCGSRFISTTPNRTWTPSRARSDASTIDRRTRCTAAVA